MTTRILVTQCRVCACSETHLVPTGVPLEGRPLALIMGDERLALQGVCRVDTGSVHPLCRCHQHGAVLPSWRWEARPADVPAPARRRRRHAE